MPIFVKMANSILTTTKVLCQASAAIAINDAVRITGTSGDILLVAPVSATSHLIFGVANAAIANGAQGLIRTGGVASVKASGSPSLGSTMGATATSGTVTPVAGGTTFSTTIHAMLSGRRLIALGSVSGGLVTVFIQP